MRVVVLVVPKPIDYFVPRFSFYLPILAGIGDKNDVQLVWYSKVLVISERLCSKSKGTNIV